MSSSLPKTFTISRAGTSMINGVYSLDTKSKDIKYVQTISNKPMIIEIIKTKIPELDLTQTYFLIQARSKSTKPIHYYVSQSPFTSSSQTWDAIAGLRPNPNISIPPAAFNQMLQSKTIHTSSKTPSTPQKQKDINTDEKDTADGELSGIKATVRTFLTDTYLFEREGAVVHSGRDSKHGEFIILDDTIFHPQGGGQPTDKGTIQTVDGNVVFNVDFVANHHWNHSLICHFGSYANQNSFALNDKVKQKINSDDREMYARLHSAGHIIDIGMGVLGEKLGFKFEPIKGYHFPTGPYVEYGGNIPVEARGEMKALLQRELDALISTHQSVQTSAKMMDCDEYLENVVHISDPKEQEQHLHKMKITRNSVVRVMDIPGFPNAACMCGGTHVDAISRIKRILVSKFKKKNRNFRVSYKVE